MESIPESESSKIRTGIGSTLSVILIIYTYIFFKEKIKKGLIVRRQADYPALDDVISDEEDVSQSNKKKSPKKSVKQLNVSFSFIFLKIVFTNIIINFRLVKRKAKQSVRLQPINLKNDYNIQVLLLFYYIIIFYV